MFLRLEPPLLDGDGVLLGDEEVVAMAVKELPPFVWRTFAEGHVALSEEGAVSEANQITEAGGDSVGNYGSGARSWPRGQALLGSGAAVRDQR